MGCKHGSLSRPEDRVMDAWNETQAWEGACTTVDSPGSCDGRQLCSMAGRELQGLVCCLQAPAHAAESEARRSGCRVAQPHQPPAHGQPCRDRSLWGDGSVCRSGRRGAKGVGPTCLDERMHHDGCVDTVISRPGSRSEQCLGGVVMVLVRTQPYTGIDTGTMLDTATASDAASDARSPKHPNMPEQRRFGPASNVHVVWYIGFLEQRVFSMATRNGVHHVSHPAG